MSEGWFIAPAAPGGQWESLTQNEMSWIEFIRVISAGRDPKPTLARVRALRELFDAQEDAG